MNISLTIYKANQFINYSLEKTSVTEGVVTELEITFALVSFLFTFTPNYKGIHYDTSSEHYGSEVPKYSKPD